MKIGDNIVFHKKRTSLLFVCFRSEEADQQPIEISGNRVGFPSAGADIKLYTELNINVNSNKAPTQRHRHKGPQED